MVFDYKCTNDSDEDVTSMNNNNNADIDGAKRT